MDNSSEQFQAGNAIEQKPFEPTVARNFFNEWCSINDSINPQFVDRQLWQERGINILEKRDDGIQNLYIPTDLQLWEMMGIIETVENDTFYHKPEKIGEKAEKIQHLGELFRDSGVYITQRLDGIFEGKNIAEAISENFYKYGNSLISGEKAKEEFSVKDMQRYTLSEARLDQIDHFLAGDSLYKSRKERVEKALTESPDQESLIVESQRQNTLNQFFRVAETAYLKQKDSGTHPNSNLQNSSSYVSFIEKVEGQIQHQVETPRRELEDAIFERGLESILREMKDPGHYHWKTSLNSFFEKVGINLNVRQRELTQSLKIDSLKSELAQLRSTNDLKAISQKEKEIVDEIQGAVGSFKHQESMDNPARIVKNQFINCVGASLMAGTLLQEVGINYLVADAPDHSFLFLVRSDGKIEWRDMLNKEHNETLRDSDIQNPKKDGNEITTSDIFAYSKMEHQVGLMIDILPKNPLKRAFRSLPLIGKDAYLTLYTPEIGHKIQVLNNLAVSLENTGKLGEANEAYKKILEIDPNNASMHWVVGSIEELMGNNEKAAVAYQKASQATLEGEYKGDSLRLQGKFEEAIGAYKKEADEHAEAPVYYGLGKALQSLGEKKEASEAFKKFLKLADPNEDMALIERARQELIELSR